MRRWAYYSQKGRDGTLNSSRLLIPDDLPGPVVLDATATQNFLWTLLEQRAEIASIPQGARNYAQVTLRVAQVPGGLGKGAMTKLCKERIPRVLANLARTLPSDRKVLLCVHKAVEPVALTYAPNFAKFSVAHWGAIDGKNDWCEYDTSVILGLSYRDQVRRRERAVRASVAVQRHLVRRGSEGNIGADAAFDPPKALADRDGARAHGAGQIARQRIVAARIQDHEAGAVAYLHLRQDGLHGDQLKLNVRLMFERRIDRHDIVLTADLQAMPGIEEQRHMGLTQGAAEIADAAGEIGELEVAPIQHIEIQTPQGCGEGSRVVGRVRQRGRIVIRAIADDERHTLLKLHGQASLSKSGLARSFGR